jgi:subtilase-type serine protease
MALAATGVLATMSNAAYGADTTVVAGTPRTTALNMAGADTLTVQAGGSFQTSATAVTINGASTTLSIDNAGTIKSTGNRAIRLNDSTINNSHSLTLTNRSTGLIESNGDDTIQISNPLYGGTVLVENYGTITSTASRAINLNAATGGTIRINNYATGVISAATGADVMRPGENATINNYGKIQSSVNADSFSGDGIDFQDKGGGAVNNFTGGLIEGSKHGITGDLGATIVNEAGATIRGRNGSGINFDTGATTTVHVTNYGLISGEAQVTSSTDTDGDGVDVDGLVAIENYGTIQALGARGFKDGVLTDPNISDAISIGGGTINNYADGVIHSVQRGILVDDSEGGAAHAATSIYNEGEISSDIGQAITLTGDWNDTLVNKGEIIGDVLMGGGDDAVTLHAGQSIDGLLDGQVGSNTLTLADNGTSTVGSLDNFQTLNASIAGNGDHGHLNVDGVVTLDGGAIALTAAKGPYTLGSSYTLIDAAGGIEGTRFDRVTSDFLFIDPTLGGGDNTVSVTLDRNDVAFASVANSANQRAVANAIDAANGNGELYRWVFGAEDPVALANSFALLDGEVHADVTGALAQQSMQAELAILSRLSRIGGAKAPANSAPLAYGEEPKAKGTSAFNALSPADMGYSAWTQAFGSWTSTDGDDNAAGVDTSLGGVLVGADLTGDGYTLGLAGGYSRGSTDIDDRASSADIDTGLLALYGGMRFDQLRLRGGASIAWSSIETKRTTVIGDIVERPEASYDATTTNLFAELGYESLFGAATVEPFAGIGWVNVDADGFSESNAPITGLRSDGASFDTPYTTLGVRASTDVTVSGVRLTPRGMLGWRHAFQDVPDAALAFSGSGTGFTVDGAPIARDSLLLEAGLDVALNVNVNLGLTYAGSFGDGATSNAVKLNGEFKF